MKYQRIIMKKSFFIPLLFLLSICIILFLFLFPVNTFIKSNISLSSIKKNLLSNSDHNNENPKLLFWTGGYDSTFRLCQILFTSSSSVLPIYIADPSMDGENVSRKNRKQEYHAMQNILSSLYSINPSFQQRIYPILYIHKVPICPYIRRNMRILYEKGLVHRPITQYSAMAQVCYNLGKSIEVGVENSEHSTMGNIVKNNIVYNQHSNTYQMNPNRKLLKNKEDQAKMIFSNFDFPIIKYRKEDMLLEAEKYKYDTILKQTWSCWFPENGRKCGKCPMCKERIL
jgi:hypothetical protein